eukprot:11182248-Alexandrium_andersonii.AAC.1
MPRRCRDCSPAASHALRAACRGGRWAFADGVADASAARRRGCRAAPRCSPSAPAAVARGPHFAEQGPACVWGGLRRAATRTWGPSDSAAPSSSAT